MKGHKDHAGKREKKREGDGTAGYTSANIGRADTGAAARREENAQAQAQLAGLLAGAKPPCRGDYGA